MASQAPSSGPARKGSVFSPGSFHPGAKAPRSETKSRTAGTFHPPDPTTGSTEPPIANKPWDRKTWITIAAVAVLIVTTITAAAMKMSDTFGPVIALIDLELPEKAQLGYTEVTAQQNGDVLSAQMKTDGGHREELCDEVMDKIYDLAGENSSAQQLKLDLIIEGKTQTIIPVDDLDIVRKFSDRTAYENSVHRRFVGQYLVDAGLIDKSALDSAATDDVNTPKIEDLEK
ncbi:MAG TPA: hypothetical protein VL981_06560 [Candidatus Methylacidiphilales bacterium]|nr:hypothetical protein [Candidatus Methylacidiphilales bacterium]